VVWRQAAGVVARLLDADGARRGGASVKTLTLAPGVAAKKVTHAVVCETLKHVPILKLVLADAGVALADDVVPNRRRRRAEDAERGERGEDSGEDDASGEEENASDGNDGIVGTRGKSPWTTTTRPSCLVRWRTFSGTNRCSAPVSRRTPKTRRVPVPPVPKSGRTSPPSSRRRGSWRTRANACEPRSNGV
jgi:hypothetical protein